MTRKQLYDSFYKTALSVYGDREAAAVAYFIIEGLYGISRIDIAIDGEKSVNLHDDHNNILAEIAAARPAQYIVGHTVFCGLNFVVEEGILIPRPETEELVEWLVNENSKNESRLRILDIGTGSGAIAIATASVMKTSEVMAVDISPAALKVAEQNARQNNVSVRFLTGDALSEEWGKEFVKEHGLLDIVVSNPPYIPDSERETMERNVTAHEPSLALFVPDNDPLIFYRAIAKLGISALKQGGWIYLEVHESYADDTAILLDEYGYKEVEVRKDINGRKRMVRCVKQ